MKILLILTLLAMPVLITAQTIRMPDPALRNRLIALGYDENDNGKLEVAEVRNIKELKLTGLGIVNLEGINSFSSLEELNVGNNKIERINVSALKNLKGLYAYDNPLTEVNVTGLSNLENLYLLNNGGSYGLERSFIRTLDVSTLTNLKNLSCARNLLTSLDVSGLDKLEMIDYQGNALTSVSLRRAPSLKSVNLKDNPLKGTVDIRGLVNLEYFNCEGCQLLFLNMTGTVKLSKLYW